MALTEEQKEVIDKNASEMMNNGFNKVYEEHLQSAVNEGNIDNDDVNEADIYMRNKIKEII